MSKRRQKIALKKRLKAALDRYVGRLNTFELRDELTFVLSHQCESYVEIVAYPKYTLNKYVEITVNVSRMNDELLPES
jgi:hypothetical protein